MNKALPRTRNYRRRDVVAAVAVITTPSHTIALCRPLRPTSHLPQQRQLRQSTASSDLATADTAATATAAAITGSPSPSPRQLPPGPTYNIYYIHNNYHGHDDDHSAPAASSPAAHSPPSTGQYQTAIASLGSRPRTRLASLPYHRDLNSTSHYLPARPRPRHLRAAPHTGYTARAQLDAAKMSSSAPTLRFRPEIAALLGQQTFRVSARNRGFIRISSTSRLHQFVMQILYEDYFDIDQQIARDLRARAGNLPVQDRQLSVGVNAFILAGFSDEAALREYLWDPAPNRSNAVGEPAFPRLELMFVAHGAKVNAAPCRLYTTSPASDEVKFFDACLAWRGASGEKCMNCAWKMSRGPACNAQEDSIIV
ncbi:hypothetical protein Micbo1qcDRAFT_180974 [Microdochium bolleyi]|uniref:Uncharacterized protein n=1 Tax=Microdochium bolleyi TaxID=196109 RepID=A0A136IKG9_9PEZI|nr:hypothetical protein Micbo1qcDRAFT_180974 [Microdochium bolleyi]